MIRDNKALENLTIVLNKAENELEFGNIQQAKTLMNTYRNLLSIVTDIKTSQKEYRLEILKHNKTLQKLEEEIQDKIKKCLFEYSYKESFDLTLIAETIKKCLAEISKLLPKVSDDQSIKYIAEKISKIYGVDVKLVTAIVEQESGFKHDFVSGMGNVGLMGVMPNSFKEFNLLDPVENLEVGIYIIHQLLENFDGNVAKALYAYNTGQSLVEKITNSDYDEWKETKRYARLITSRYNQLKEENIK